MFKILLLLILMTSQCWAIQAWRNGTGENTMLGTSNASDIDTNTQNNIVKPLDDLLANYRQSMAVYYSSASQLIVSGGSVTVSNSGGTIRLMLKNSGTTTIDFTNIDTGAEASATTYYVYAIAATTSSTSATFKISANSTSPSGITYYKLIGTFYNNSASDIDPSKVYAEPYGSSPTDANGAKMIQAVYDYGSSTSSYTARSGAVIMAYGATTIGSGSSSSISNLPFTNSSSYVCTASETAGGSTDESRGSIGVSISSGSVASVYNTDNASHSAYWFCVGT